MTNAELIQKIRAEIERQRKFIEGMFIEGDNNFYDGQDDAYNNILTFLSTLESEKPIEQDEDLNEEIKKFIDEYGYERGADKLLIAIVARHFAQWQKEQDEKELSDLLTIAHLQGADQMKEQMLKEAVAEVEVGMRGDPIEIILDKYVQRAMGIFPRDKVRIIIVKEDEK